MEVNKFATPHFKWDELRCKGCDGSCSWSVNGKPLVSVTESALLKLEEMRVFLDVPMRINSASRCPRHNSRVGGAPLSQHRATLERGSTAFDVALTGRAPKEAVIAAAEAAGFGGIGINYRTFVHVDDRGRVARW